MSQTITVAPVTRIEGHLDIEVTVEAVDGVQRVTAARCAGTMFRGFEMLLKGRHPRDAVHLTQRICGVCPTSHGMAAALALEAAYGPHATPPANGRILRNLILGADFLQSHILHFYQLALLDYVDASEVFKHASWKPGYSGPDVVSGAEADKLLGHYAAAWDIRRKAHQLGAVFGGRMPCSPVFVPGGCTQTLTDTTAGGESPATEKVRQFQNLLDEIRSFIEAAYLPDAEFLMRRFPEYAEIGRGCGRLLAFGGFDLDATGTKKLLPGGVFADRQTSRLDPDNIVEFVQHSRYSPVSGGRSPSLGETEPDARKPDSYSWIKSPRYAKQAYEVGPLARMWIGGFYRRGISVLDRLLARAQEAQRIAGAMVDWLRELQVGSPTRARFPYLRSGTGVGLAEAPRGAIGHWLQFHKHAIDRYQILTPTTWNASPRDDVGEPGPIEQALVGTPVRRRDQPVELLRVVHSFDPCLACSVH